MATVIGADVSQDFNQAPESVKKMRAKIVAKVVDVDNTKKKVKVLTTLSANLSNGYNNSMKMVVNLNKVLENYAKFFSDLDKLLSTINVESIIDPEDIRKMKEHATSTLQQSNSDFKAQLARLQQIYNENGLSDQANALSRIVDEYGSSTSSLNQLGGGPSVFKKNGKLRQQFIRSLKK